MSSNGVCESGRSVEWLQRDHQTTEHHTYISTPALQPSADPSACFACCLLLAALLSCKQQVPLPESPPWYALFGSPLQQIYEVAATLHQLYRAQKPRFIPVCHQLLPSKPLTPALQAAHGEGGGGEAGATPLLGRPGRPLDPSVRRLVGEGSTRAVGATPGQVGACFETGAALFGFIFTRVCSGQGIVLGWTVDAAG
jgi:hypothetical protein